ncbi:MAG: serine/threonine-protein kinase [Gemmatimonadaceae bacterium]
MKLCPTCTAEYEESERFCPKDGTPLRSRESGSTLLGSVIADRYHVLSKLGEGGMGQVYLAEHLRMKRKSAVKVMHQAMTSDADAIGRFHREASNACQIDHPNVAAVYDFGESGDGVIYLAMEYVEGSSLAKLIADQGSLTVARTAEIIRQVADGLDAAHRLGIVHRDLKPDNILVGTHHDGRDRVKIVDFGISKAARREGQSVTQSGQIIGTPDYMSPEQISGEIAARESDIYSLGIVAFNALTGQLPFKATNQQSAMLLRLTEPPQRLAAVRPEIVWPRGLQAVLDTALAIDAAGRYASASTFATAFAAATGLAPSGGPLASPHADATTIVAQSPGAPATPAQPITPGSFSLPIPCGLTEEELGVLRSKLARFVGPIAKVLVRRAAVAAPTRKALVAALAQEIESEPDRELFRQSVS